MRPKKRILLFCDHMNRYEELRFILTVRSYEVLDSWPMDINPNEVDWPSVSVIFQTRPGNHMQQAIDAMIEDSVRIMFINESVEHKEPYMESKIAAYYSECIPASEWLERLRVLCGRKRGPRTGINSTMVIA